MTSLTDLENLCREAAMHALRSNIAVASITPVNFKNALSVCHPSLTAEKLAAYQVGVAEVIVAGLVTS